MRTINQTHATSADLFNDKGVTTMARDLSAIFGRSQT
jgi:hypothetical protein